MAGLRVFIGIVVALVLALPASSRAQDEKKVTFSGEAIIEYSIMDYDTNSKKKGGDFTFGRFGFGVDASYKGLTLSAKYMWYSYMDVVARAYLGYNFSETLQCQLGIHRVPFGVLPYPDHNWWFGVPFYLGLEDDIDMGIKLIQDDGPLNIQLAFYKNAEWGDGTKLESYSMDVVNDGTYENEEINQFNGRVAYDFQHGEDSKTEVGLSGQFGRLFNSTTRSRGSHWAGAVHLDGYYGPWNIQLEAVRYEYSPDYGPGVREDVVCLGGFAGSYLMAAKGTVLVGNVAYDLPVNWGPISNLKFYNDFSMQIKDEDDWDDSIINVLGCEVSGGPLFAYVDFIMAKNMVWLGGANDSLAFDDSLDEWGLRFNLNIGYYF